MDLNTSCRLLQITVTDCFILIDNARFVKKHANNCIRIYGDINADILRYTADIECLFTLPIDKKELVTEVKTKIDELNRFIKELCSVFNNYNQKSCLWYKRTK